MSRPPIHRMNSTGRPRCGVAEGYVSSTGVCVTCPDCQEKPVDRDAAMKQIQEAAARFRQKGFDNERTNR